MVWKNPRAIYEFLDIGFDLKTLIRVTVAGMIGFITQLFDWFTSQTVAFQWGWGAGISIFSLLAITKGYQTIQKDNSPLSLGIPVLPAAELIPRKNEEDGILFDMRFEEALSHVVSFGTPYITYQMKDRPIAEREIARRFHEMACQGEIRIAGMRRGSIRLEKIDPEQLIELTPSDAGIPKSSEAPEGYHWIFAPEDPPTDKEYTTYWGLRVDSRDVYKFWPRDESISENQEALTKEQIHRVKAGERDFKADIDLAFKYVSQVHDPRILNPKRPGNPHAIKYEAQNATDALISQLKARKIDPPEKLDAENDESLKVWRDFLRDLRVSFGPH